MVVSAKFLSFVVLPDSVITVYTWEMELKMVFQLSIKQFQLNTYSFCNWNNNILGEINTEVYTQENYWALLMHLVCVI